MPISGMYDTWISGSDVNSFCCYGLVYPLDSWYCLRSQIEVHLHLHLHLHTATGDHWGERGGQRHREPEGH